MNPPSSPYPGAPQTSASPAPGPHPVASSMRPRSPRLCPSHYRCPFRSHCLCPAASAMPCDPLEENRLCVSAAGAAGYLWKRTPLNHFQLHPAAVFECVCERHFPLQVRQKLCVCVCVAISGSSSVSWAGETGNQQHEQHPLPVHLHSDVYPPTFLH